MFLWRDIYEKNMKNRVFVHFHFGVNTYETYNRGLMWSGLTDFIQNVENLWTGAENSRGNLVEEIPPA